MWSQLNGVHVLLAQEGFTDPDRFYLDGLIKEPTYIFIAISGPNDDFSISKFLYGFKFIFGLRFAN